MIQVSWKGTNSLQVPSSQGLVHVEKTSTTTTTTTLQASSEEYAAGYYGLDTSPLQESLKAVRESMDSMQESIDATKQTLGESSLSSTATKAISDASSLSHNTIAPEVVPSSSNSIMEPAFVQLEDATQIWKDVMTQLQQNAPKDDYFPSSSVDSMRDSLNSIQQSIRQVHQTIHPGSDGTSSMLLASSDLPASDIASDAVAAAVTNHVPTLVDYLAEKTGLVVVGDYAADFQSQLSSSIMSSEKQAWKDASNFLENASSSASSMTSVLSNAKIKLSMMISNTYLVLGLEPPETYVKSGATITPSFSLITAFFALLWAMGSKEMARSQAEESMKAIILEYQRQQATLKTQMVRS